MGCRTTKRDTVRLQPYAFQAATVRAKAATLLNMQGRPSAPPQRARPQRLCRTRPEAAAAAARRRTRGGAGGARRRGIRTYVESRVRSDLGQLALRRPLSAPARHPGCPEASASLGQPRPASASLGQSAAWAALPPAGHTGLAFHIEACPAPEKRTMGGPGESCALGEPPRPSWEGEPLLASGEGGMKLVRAPGEGEG